MRDIIISLATMAITWGTVWAVFEKAGRGIPLPTSVITVVSLAAIGLVMLSLGLWLLFLSYVVGVGLWAFLAAQRISHETSPTSPRRSPSPSRPVLENTEPDWFETRDAGVCGLENPISDSFTAPHPSAARRDDHALLRLGDMISGTYSASDQHFLDPDPQRPEPGLSCGLPPSQHITDGIEHLVARAVGKVLLVSVEAVGID